MYNTTQNSCVFEQILSNGDDRNVTNFKVKNPTRPQLEWRQLQHQKQRLL